MHDQTHGCAVRGCNERISVRLVLCWGCLSRVPEWMRKELDAARQPMGLGFYGADVIARYRLHRDEVIDAAQDAFDRRKRKVGSSRVDLQACKLEYSIVSPK